MIPPKQQVKCKSIDVLIYGITITSENDFVKYPGILIDSKPKYDSHISTSELKLSRAVGIITKLKSILSKNLPLQLYYTLVHPNLLYGLIVWGRLSFIP